VIGYVLYLTCGSPIANLIARYLKVTSIDNNDLKNIIKGGVGVLLCLVSLMVGSLVILLPCYFLIYKRLFHLHQKKSPVKTKTQTPISKIQGKKI
jgi:membrane-anchored glycerophosphoryl diester phosphodiesterase (GDPDase)